MHHCFYSIIFSAPQAWNKGSSHVTVHGRKKAYKHPISDISEGLLTNITMRFSKMYLNIPQGDVHTFYNRPTGLLFPPSTPCFLENDGRLHQFSDLHKFFPPTKNSRYVIWRDILSCLLSFHFVFNVQSSIGKSKQVNSWMKSFVKLFTSIQSIPVSLRQYIPPSFISPKRLHIPTTNVMQPTSRLKQPKSAGW